MTRPPYEIAHHLFASHPAPFMLSKTDGEADVNQRKAKPTILVVDDEQLIADSITEILNDNGYAATAVYGGLAAVEAARQLKPDLLLTDVLMPRLNGIETALRVSNACEKTRILLFSGQAGTTDLIKGAQTAGLDFKLLPKPIHPDHLLRTLSGMLHS